MSPGHVEQLFGKTTVKERPVGFRSTDGIWYVVLRGGVDDPGSEDETLWWSLCRIEGGECVELARDYGVEEVEGDVVEVSWDGLFPLDWVESFVEGKIDWIRLSVTEVMENFGDTVRNEQPQGWRHREGRWHLVLVGEQDEETGEEEYAWSLVEENCGEYREVAVCHPGNGFGDDEEDGAGDAVENDVHVAATTPSAESSAPGIAPEFVESDPSIGDFLDGWWEEPPFAWGERTLERIEAREA
jgi:hypothetical protein